MSLYDQTLPQLLKMLRNLEGWLDKANEFCSANEIEFETLMHQRLYPNMYDLRGQLEHGCFNATLFAARMASLEAPDPGLPGTSFEDAKAYVARAAGFIEAIDASACAAAEDRWVEIPKVPGMKIRVTDMAREFSLPNVYFHLTTAYGIMRGIGVPVGKADFMGALSLIPAQAATA